MSLIALVVAGIPVYVRPQIEELRKADAVMVIGGYGWDRVPYSLDLAWKRWAPNLVISNTGAGDTWLDSFCSVPPDQLNVYCFDPDPSTTRGEARAFARLAAENHWDSVIVVTARPHISRARLILQRCFSGEIIMVQSPAPMPWHRWIYEYAYQTAAFGRALLATGC